MADAAPVGIPAVAESTANHSKAAKDVKPKEQKVAKASKAPKAPKASKAPKATNDLKVPKVLKEKKPRAPKVTPSHPPYSDMIVDAISSLKERTGSSPYAIVKFLEEKHTSLPSNFKKACTTYIKKLHAEGKLVKVKASFKLGLDLKKPPKKEAAPKAVKAGKPKTVKVPPTTIHKVEKKAVESKARNSKSADLSKETKKVAAIKPKKVASVKKSMPAKKATAAKKPKTTVKTSAKKTTPVKKPTAKKVKTTK